MKPNSRHVNLFITAYLSELTKNANAGLLPWASRLSQTEFDSKIEKIVTDATLAFLGGRGTITSGPAIKAVAKSLKLKSAKAVTAWMFEED
jgi:hypothetical protein